MIVIFVSRLVFCLICVFSSLQAAYYPSTAIWVKSADEFNAVPTIAKDAYDYLQGAKKSQNVARFIFVRHGESTSNKEKSLAGRTLDVDLSEEGVVQAETVGRKLRGLALDLRYSSPSLRARRTAALILGQLGDSGEVILDELLYERYLGPYEGASEKDYAPVINAEKEHGVGPDKSFYQKFNFRAHPDMESMHDVYERLMIFAGCLFKCAVVPEFRGKNILVTTHNSPLKALFMADAAKRGYDIDYSSFILDNGAIVVVEVSKDGGIQVVATSGLAYRKR